MQVAVVTSDPGVGRALVGELEPMASRFAVTVLHPLQAPDTVRACSFDVVLVDMQAISAVQPDRLTEAICGTAARGGFLACCSGCPVDRHRIAAIESAGGLWQPLPSSGAGLSEFLGKVCATPDAALARASFLAAFWELAADAASLPEPAPRTSWIGSVGDLLARLLRQRPIAENGG